MFNNHYFVCEMTELFEDYTLARGRQNVYEHEFLSKGRWEGQFLGSIRYIIVGVIHKTCGQGKGSGCQMSILL